MWARPWSAAPSTEAHIQADGFHVVRDEPDRATRLAHARIARVRRQRAANENLRLGNLWYAMDLYAALLTMP